MSERMPEAARESGRTAHAGEPERVCPVDGVVLLQRRLPQDGRSRLCPSCGTWWA